MYYKNLPEEELKNRIGEDYFADYDYKKIIGKVDFCVQPKKDINYPEFFQPQSLLWAEAKRNKRDIIEMFAQLILTIGKARTFTQHLPPAFLGVFDAEKIAFVPYEKVRDLFYKNDFNWNVAPSNHTTKEFAEIKNLINDTLEREKYLYYFGKDDNLLKIFIKNNLAKGTEESKIQIDKNNFFPIYLRWYEEIKPLIHFDFENGRKQQILDSDFYLADLFVDDKNTNTIKDDVSIREDLFVVFKNEGYEIAKENLRQLYDAVIKIKNTATYENFWKRYKRPPIKEFQDYIIKRRDLLVPQDIRERKGAFFTPQKWVSLSQECIAKVLGEDWQDEYYVWDCAAGTGNLLTGLINKRNIYASTIDQADVQVMQERIKNGTNLLENHVFQFDFLNDDFFDVEKDTYDIDTGDKLGKRLVKSKLPQSLQEVLKDPKKRKKLVIYINPPYAEATTARTVMRTGENKVKVATDNKTHRKYKKEIGKAANELFVQFLYRIYKELPSVWIANFSTLKNLQSSNFDVFREQFTAKLEKLFLLPAYTFDNVNGKFPIGFFVWNTTKQEKFKEITADVYDEKGKPIENKKITSFTRGQRINEWIKTFDVERQQKNEGQEIVAYMENPTPDFQNNKFLNIAIIERERHNNYFGFTSDNLQAGCVYFAVRHSVKMYWFNDRDQFLYPNDSWQNDKEFHCDCLVFTLFHGQNRITTKEGINHWIPFTEIEINAKEAFSSTFMTDFIAGKIKKSNGNGDLFNAPKVENGTKCKFSPEAQAVFDSGKELWRYYHAQKYDVNVNASLYDIREHFQGRNEKGKMNNKSTDEKYTELMSILRKKLKTLADKIAGKVYEHGFLKA